MGPLDGLRVLEFGGIGPGPFCGMLLSDLGADVLRIDQAGKVNDLAQASMRGRRSIALDLKSPSAIEACLALIEGAHMLIESSRPGAMERLGLGPDPALRRNPALVYGRMTGWGQTGPYATTAGHDINYLAVSGALHAIGGERPAIPINLLGDVAGGALYLAFGMLAALTHARATGQGQVVDAAIVDGAASMMTNVYAAFAAGRWRDARESNLLDGGAPFYNVYRCSDDKWVAIGALEPKFYATLRERIGADETLFDDQYDRALWAAQRARFGEIFASKTRDEWVALLEGSDGCLSPVLNLAEAPLFAHNVARQSFSEASGAPQPAPAPRFSRSAVSARPMVGPSQDGVGELMDWGVNELVARAAFAQ